MIFLGSILLGTVSAANGTNHTINKNPVKNTTNHTIYHNSTKSTEGIHNHFKWKFNLENTTSSAPSIGPDGTIYIGSNNFNQYAINQNGTLKWKYTTLNEIYGGPKIGNNGTIYIGSSDRNLYAINSNGSLKWKYETGNDIFGSTSIASDGTIYIGSCDGYLYALNSNGTLKWKYRADDFIYGSSVIGSDGTIYVGCGDGCLYSISPNGTLKWKYKTKNNVYGSLAIASDGTIYFGSYDHNLYALNPNGTLKWYYTTGNRVLSTPIIGNDGTIYFGSYDNNFYALNPDGTQKWSFNIGSSIWSSPAIGSGNIYIASRNGYLYAIGEIPNATATPKGGDYNTKQIVTLEMNKNGKIYYTLDGRTPTDQSTLYNGPITIKNTTTLKFIAIDNYGNISPPYIEHYNIILPQVTATPKGGDYKTKQVVTLQMHKKGNIYYTLDGTTPTTKSILYKGPITITNTTTLKFIAIDIYGNISPPYTEQYNITLPKVTATPKGGNYKSIQVVTLQMNKDGNIYYTLDGTNPTDQSTLYKGPITIRNNTTLKFIAIDNYGNISPECTEIYKMHINYPKATATPIGDNFNNDQVVTFRMNKIGNIYYTLDGTNPTDQSILYIGPITIKNTTTLKFIGIDNSGNISLLYTEIYNIDNVLPTAHATPKAGNYNTKQVVMLQMNKLGKIYYTLDGTTPTNKSTLYNGPITITKTSTLKFIAIDIFGNISPLYIKTYSIDKTLPKVISTTPLNNQKNVSRNSVLTVKFSEKIQNSINYKKITITYLKTNKKIGIIVTIKKQHHIHTNQNYKRRQYMVQYQHTYLSN